MKALTLFCLFAFGLYADTVSCGSDCAITSDSGVTSTGQITMSGGPFTVPYPGLPEWPIIAELPPNFDLNGASEYSFSGILNTSVQTSPSGNAPYPEATLQAQFYVPLALVGSENFILLGDPIPYYQNSGGLGWAILGGVPIYPNSPFADGGFINIGSNGLVTATITENILPGFTSNSFGFDVSVLFAGPAIPEPASMGLVIVSALFLLLLVRYRRRNV